MRRSFYNQKYHQRIESLIKLSLDLRGSDPSRCSFSVKKSVSLNSWYRLKV